MNTANFLNLNSSRDETIINVVDTLFQSAIEKNISDIHIEPQAEQYRVRFRRDGLLFETANLPNAIALRVVSRLKLLANLDITERRLPQDGHIKLKLNHGIDIRINSCPTLYGEKIALRLLVSNTLQPTIDKLGWLDEEYQLFFNTINAPQGLVIITGPTGSGKTTTLYSALNHLNKIDRHIISVEDPIEIEIEGINQINIHPKIGLDFATILRAVLRQDPDIIMVGEIRDIETASIAMEAAQTGHLVLTTLHTNSTVDSIIRLLSMGIPAYQIASSLSMVVAQRLLRKLCEHCKRKESASKTMQTEFMLVSPIIYQARGCEQCTNGYSGRTAIFECLIITDHIKQCILTDNNKQSLQTLLLPSVRHTLWKAGTIKAHEGVTSVAELLRVIKRESHV